MTTQPHPRTINQRGLVLAVGGIALATFLAIAFAGFLAGDSPVRYHTPPLAIAVHLATALPAIPLGAWILWGPKGNARHKLMGRIWAMMMMVTAIASYWLRGAMGGIGPIHIFSVVTLISIPLAIYSARSGNIRGHRRAMTGPYIGLIMAGLFAFAPARLLGQLVFG